MGETSKPSFKLVIPVRASFDEDFIKPPDPEESVQSDPSPESAIESEPPAPPFPKNIDIFKTDEPTSLSFFNLVPPWVSPFSLWSRLFKETGYDLVRVSVEKEETKILLFEKYPMFRQPAERPICDPLLRCARILSLLRVTWR